MKSGYIYLDNNVFPTLFAISSEEQQKGLMYLDPPTPNMTFVYGSPQINKFWMYKTKAPLDILFCIGGKVCDICYGEPYSTKSLGNCLSDLVIEFPYGTIEEVGIKVGSIAGVVEPTIGELKKIIAGNSGINFF